MSDSRHPGRRTSLFSGLALAAITVIVAACGSSTATPTAAPTAAPTTAGSAAPSAAPVDTTPTGGTITERVAADISSWDPCVVQAATVPGTMGDILNAVYGALVYKDYNGVVQPGMVQSLTTKDATTWTFKLRAGVKFTDGTDYDAAALKYNFDRAADPANACTSQKWIATWKSVDVVDASTLNVVLAGPDAAFDGKIAESAAFVASPTALKAATDKPSIQPVGAGPFTMLNRNQGITTILAKNKKYWDAPRPYVDQLQLPIIPESNAGQAQIVSGQLDIMFGYAYQYGANATKPGVATKVVPINGYNSAYFITNGGTTGLFNDVDARMAVAYGVDRNKWVNALTQVDSIKAPDSIYPSTSPYYDATMLYPKFDAAKAQELINKVIAKGKKFEFTILAPNSSDTLRSAQYLQQAMSTYTGVTATINTVAAAAYNTECLAKHGDICIQPGATMWNGPEPNTYNLLSSKGSQPFSAYSSADMDAALDKTLTAVSDADKVTAYKAVEKIFFQDLPFIQYGNQTRTMLIRDDIGGFVWAGQGQLQAQFLYVCKSKCN